MTTSGSVADGDDADGDGPGSGTRRSHRVTISDRLLITTVAGQRTETTLGSDAEVLAAYREHFGFTLDRLPTPP